ncbi:MFS transporter [Lactobacillus mulieris]|jgi:inner membrane transporter ydiM|uniref:MFS transporter n=1 Tax=Lactobacillus mulieris TaxID=2508708 RepID=A0AAP3M3V9_9LACO|nr:MULTISPECIES: MFS transporter [Lactobacillus]EEX23364.1 transporter, major facilitator family protein [Lactobacillus jensenii 115-3-CHN]KAA9245097.1 MFS transporter [Lactobacillus jensenii]KAA9367954.1 MFS transporter [Lactobacillus jensenii]KAA9371272.1 MFS transporter [Lactobacillus jensenii]MCF1796734.1 MFS transporter [Lactobacillus mulieris]
MKNKYTPTALALYFNYFVHGMGVIILSQNAANLAHQWGTTETGALAVVSSLGIGRIINLLASGVLSDKFGRKPFVQLGIVTYFIFFVGILMSPNTVIAYILGILAGMANSFLDTGTYPGLMEIYPNSKGTSNVVLKAFISAGQFFLPFIVSFLAAAHMWYGWSFLIPATILVLTFLYFMFGGAFPDSNSTNKTVEEKITDNNVKTNLWLDGTLFIIYGYISQATFYLVSQMLTQYGQKIGNLSQVTAHSLVSWYSLGSIICVLTTAVLGKKFSEIQFVPIYTLGAFISLALMWLYPTNASLMIILSILVGFFAAGGVMQLALTVMAEFFPAGKGTVTGFFYTAGSIASFTIPLAINWIGNMRNVMLFDVIIALIGFIDTSMIAMRYKKMFGKLGK